MPPLADQLLRSYILTLHRLSGYSILVDDYAFTVNGCGDIECQYGVITNTHLVPILSTNSLLISQLTHTRKIVGLWLDRFVVKDVNNWEGIAKGFFVIKDRCYKFHDVPKKFYGLSTLMAHVDDRSSVWHE